MQIKKLESPEGYLTYEILDETISEGVFYLAINKSTKLVNIYVVTDEEEFDAIGANAIKFRSSLPSFMSKDGVLVMNSEEHFEQFLKDVLNDSGYEIVAKDIETEETTTAPVTNEVEPEQVEESSNDASKYREDPYHGIDPIAIEIIKKAEQDAGAGDMGDMGGDSSGDFDPSMDGDSGEDIPVDDTEAETEEPPVDDTEEK
jgi:hypothetical protein